MLHPFHGKIKADVLTFEKGLQISVRKFIARLIFAIVFMFLLDCVVGQMAVEVAGVVIKLFAAGPQIALLVPVGLKLPSERGHQCIGSDIKFPIFVKQRVDVLLDQCTFAAFS